MGNNINCGKTGETLNRKQICKKITAAAVICMLGVNTCASAAVGLVISRDPETNVVSGTVEIGEGTKYRPVTILVKNEREDVVYIAQVYADESGRADFKYLHKSDNAGTGLMTVTAQYNDESANAQYSVVDSAVLAALVNKIADECAKASPSSAALKASYIGDDANENGKPDNAETLSLDLTVYETLENKDGVFVILGNDPANKSLSSAGDAIEAFYAAVVLEKLAENRKAETVSELLGNSLYSWVFAKDKIPVNSEKVSVIDTLDESVREKVYERLAATGCTQREKLGDDFVLYTLTEALRYGIWQNVNSLIKTYIEAGYISIDMSEYNALKDRSSVDKALADRQYSSYSEIENAFLKAVADRKKAENSKPTTGGGGGGGGRGGGMTVAVSTENATPKPDTAIENAQTDVNSGAALSGKPIFEDMSEAPWAIEAVEALYKRGIINGTSDKSFEPNRGITRAEFMKILVCMENLKPVEDDVFVDVTSDMWYYTYAAAAYRAGIAEGDDQRRFNGDSIVNREEMAAMVYRMFDRHNDKPAPGATTAFDDVEDVSDWALDAVNYLKGLGVINGRNRNFFEPKAELTRAEAAVAIYKSLEKIGD